MVTTMPHPPLSVRFSRYFTKNKSGCWEWTAKLYSNGYGCLMHNHRYVLAHRVAWELFVGPIPDGLQVCHRCDNRRCVNPKHLFIGTQRANMRDMVSKGRDRPSRGEANQRAKLSDEDVRAIRRRARTGEMQSDIAGAYGVSRKQVSVIVSRKQWAHIK